jgi:transcriptional regulator with XRE-family HTH domain
MATFGERLQARRYYKGFTQSELAQEIGLPGKNAFRTLQEWERGRSMPRYRSRIDALGKALDVSPEWLLHGETNPHEAPGYDAPNDPIPGEEDVILVRLNRIEKQLDRPSQHLGAAKA